MATEDLNTETGSEGTVVEKSDEEQIADFLTKNGSAKLLERMETPEGKEFCVSYIKANLDEAKGKVAVAAGWLEQSLDD